MAVDQVRAVAQQRATSHGTEMSLYRGTGPFHHKRFDTERRLFVTREGGSAYPQTMGYEWVGRVTEVGAGMSGYRVRDMVHLPSPHRQWLFLGWAFWVCWQCN